MFNQSMICIRTLIETIFKLDLSFQFCWLIRGMEVMKNTKFQLNISKIMPAIRKKTGARSVNTLGL